jgi:hypothetical protein
LVDLFIKGLPSDDMKRHVSSLEPQTFAETMRRATIYEAYTPKALKKPRPSPIMPVYSSPGWYASNPQESDNARPSTQRQPQKTRRNVTCYRCGQLGHLHLDCTAKVIIQTDSSKTENNDQQDLNSNQLVMRPNYQPTPRGPTTYTSDSRQ